MRRLTLGLCVVLLAAGFHAACGAFSGSDSSTPSTNDAGTSADGSIDASQGDGASPPDAAGLDGGGSNDAGLDSGCTILFDYPTCNPVPDASIGTILPNNNDHPISGTGPSCSASVNSGASALFGGSFNTNITGTTSLDFAIKPASKPLPNVAFLGCQLHIQAQPSSDYTDVSLRITDGGQEVAHHVKQGLALAVLKAVPIPKALPANAWSHVTFELVPAPDAGSSIVTVDDGNGKTTQTYGPYNVPTGPVTVSYSCGVTAPEAMSFQVLIEGVKLVSCQ